MEPCSNFIADYWRPNRCRECFHPQEAHLINQTGISSERMSLPCNTALSIVNNPQLSSKSLPSSTELKEINSTISQQKVVDELKEIILIVSHQKVVDELKEIISIASQQKVVDDLKNDVESTPPTRLDPPLYRSGCKYARNCYRKNPEHLKKYSHSATIASRKDEQTITQKHLKLVEKQFLESIADLKNKDEYFNKATRKLRKEGMKIVLHHQQFQQTLKQELDSRKRREAEKQRILEIRRATPNYGSINAFDESYLEIDIRQESAEFNVISQLLDDTNEIHRDKYGTIYEKDSTEFLVTSITRIHNKKLWQEYCLKKESIIKRNNNQLVNCPSSEYLRDHQILTPLLDAQANEYWLFHGCDDKILRILSHAGYDPRVLSSENKSGGGLCLSENSSESNKYIPCPGCGKTAKFHGSRCSCQNQEDLIFSIILYRVVLGDVHIVKKYNEKIRRNSGKSRVRRPSHKENSVHLYDSIMGESIKYGGKKLKYREFVLHEPGQAYPEYVIQYKRSSNNAHVPPTAQRMKGGCYGFLKNPFNLRPE